jgi:predicted nucleic acid-binding protein
MPDRRFFDTNVLVYAFAAADPRSTRAEALIVEGGVFGVQVLNEFTNATRRKLRWDWEQIEASLAVIEELLGVAQRLTTAVHAQAVVLARDFKLPFYHALIVAAAMDAGCDLLCSEDLQDGQQFGVVTSLWGAAPRPLAGDAGPHDRCRLEAPTPS